MFKKICIITVIAVSSLSLLFSQTKDQKIKVGVILSGSGMMDGTEIYEAAFTVLALENANAEIVFMAPNIPQASVVNHLKNNDKETGSRNVLVESARIARGDIKDITYVKESDIDALIIPGGMGSVTTLSNILSKGALGTVDPETDKLIKAVYKAKKPIGSMCAASMILAKSLGDHKIKITVGKNNDFFGPMLTAFRAVNVESTSDNIVTDEANKIVTTPAFMGGPSNSTMNIGIDKMVKKVLKMAKK
jgi:enhancing lycopene biosynthesis protein 2